ncbi:hypothetical protein EG68_12608 [Paragonimus skrjabini miyazakii]|uniref:Uncharacterized protein n=1 Tax=Paragonimus skrjabini miyazakii TaxID=59628 RepID=A0A8S9YHW4_9TREM|nr:hypothetical protein EG68_12608 [Paragonimus skrjabini miyazakii]
MRCSITNCFKLSKYSNILFYLVIDSSRMLGELASATTYIAFTIYVLLKGTAFNNLGGLGKLARIGNPCM